MTVSTDETPDTAHTVAEVATIFNVSKQTVKSWIHDGKTFPNAFKNPSGHWRIPLRDVKANAQELYGDKTSD